MGLVGYTGSLKALIDSKLTTPAGGAAGQVLTKLSTGFGWVTPTGGSGGGGGMDPTDQTVFVSKSGSDSNDGRSWKTAVLTIAQAKTILGTANGTIKVGIGDFEVAPNTLSLRATQVIEGITTQGSDGGGSALVLPLSGTLLNLDDQTNPTVRNITLKFKDSSVTGTLVSMSNSFTCYFDNVRFRGTGTIFKGNSSRLTGIAGQIGLSLTNNAGDSKFHACEFELLGVGVDNQTTINWFTDCNWTSCSTAFRGGDLTGQAYKSGVRISGGTMRGWGTYYIDAAGTSQQWDIDGVFFDGAADTGIRVGIISGGNGYGPWSFKVYSGFISGSSVDLELNAAFTTAIMDGTVFGDSYTDGVHPTALVVGGSGQYLKQGRLGVVTNLRGSNADLAALLPSTGWQKAS